MHHLLKPLALDVRHSTACNSWSWDPIHLVFYRIVRYLNEVFRCPDTSFVNWLTANESPLTPSPNEHQPVAVFRGGEGGARPPPPLDYFVLGRFSPLRRYYFMIYFKFQDK